MQNSTEVSKNLCRLFGSKKNIKKERKKEKKRKGKIRTGKNGRATIIIVVPKAERERERVHQGNALFFVSGQWVDR